MYVHQLVSDIKSPVLEGNSQAQIIALSWSWVINNRLCICTCLMRESWRSWEAWLSASRSPRLSLSLCSSPSRLRLPSSTLVARASAASSASRRRFLSTSRRISVARCLFNWSCRDGWRRGVILSLHSLCLCLNRQLETERSHSSIISLSSQYVCSKRHNR